MFNRRSTFHVFAISVGLLLLAPMEVSLERSTDTIETRNMATVQAGFDA